MAEKYFKSIYKYELLLYILNSLEAHMPFIEAKLAQKRSTNSSSAEI